MVVEDTRLQGQRQRTLVLIIEQAVCEHKQMPHSSTPCSPEVIQSAQMGAYKRKQVAKIQVVKPQLCLKLLASLLARLLTRGSTNHAYQRLLVEKRHTSCPGIVRAESWIFKVVLCIFLPISSNHYLRGNQEAINPFWDSHIRWSNCLIKDMDLEETR